MTRIEKPHRHTLRLQEYDYSQKGMYFITICTHERKNILSKIIKENNSLEQNEKMKSNTNVGARCTVPRGNNNRTIEHWKNCRTRNNKN